MHQTRSMEVNTLRPHSTDLQAMRHLGCGKMCRVC
jgi:hypothetical protein